jgi:hypothetical protein
VIASECTVPVYTHTLRLHDLLNNDARYIKEYVHTYTMLYMYTKPSGNHNRSRSAGALFFPYTIAGRNPSFLGSTCLTQTVLEMPPPPRIDWVTHFSARIVRYTTKERKAAASNLKRERHGKSESRFFSYEDIKRNREESALTALVGDQ